MFTSSQHVRHNHIAVILNECSILPHMDNKSSALSLHSISTQYLKTFKLTFNSLMDDKSSRSNN